MTDRDKAEALRVTLCQMFGIDPQNTPGEAIGRPKDWAYCSEIMTWFQGGWTQDWIVETLKPEADRRARRDLGPPPSRRYLTAILRSRAEEAAQLPAAPEVQKVADRDRQAALVRSFLLYGNWRGEGPEPGRPGCQIAPEIIAEARARYDEKFRSKRVANV